MDAYVSAFFYRSVESTGGSLRRTDVASTIGEPSNTAPSGEGAHRVPDTVPSIKGPDTATSAEAPLGGPDTATNMRDPLGGPDTAVSAEAPLRGPDMATSTSGETSDTAPNIEEASQHKYSTRSKL